MKQFKHENVVEFKGILIKDENISLVMEFAKGGSLDSVVRNNEDIKINQIVDWCIQIVNGLDFLHNICNPPIVHRDLKCSNILIYENDRLKLADFGVSRLKDHTTQMTFAGTAAYVAPELIRGEPSSEKVDIWSFGIILWELLTGEEPYSGMVPHSHGSTQFFF